MGFVYGKDGKTPVRDAVVLIRGVDTGKVYRSEPTGEFGTYRLLDIEAGTYVVGLKIKEKSYNVNKYVKVDAGKTSFVSLFLQAPHLEIPYKQTEKDDEEEKEKFFDSLAEEAIIIGGIAAGILGYISELEGEEEISRTDR
ncbi:MAG: carboxypeptidase regulatory-like domain-containing protein [Candidatus Aminicenantes bacterium]|nr:MAG: carboxypeptidase regulatory-like domain-containing protein [Candidatus Aminicenantes bacterium]